MWCYLFIAYFDLKIGIFQQTVARVYYILNVYNIKIDQNTLMIGQCL